MCVGAGTDTEVDGAANVVVVKKEKQKEKCWLEKRIANAGRRRVQKKSMCRRTQKGKGSADVFEL
jgi:hypothetical protein